MTTAKKYTFGFNAASLRLNETINIEKSARELGLSDYEEISNKADLIGYGKARTNVREFRELKKRLEKLTGPQKDILVNGDFASQKQIAFLGVCKHYLFIREFAVEIIRDKFTVYDYQLTEGDFLTFFRSKQESNTELERLAKTTFRKARQVLWKILEQAGIIDDVESKNIQPQILGRDVIDAIVEDNPEWLKIFLYSDAEIKEISQSYDKH